MSERPAHESEDVEIVDAYEGPRLDDARALMREYAVALMEHEEGREASALQLLDAELAKLPGEYHRPGGILLVALVDGVASGCVALRRLDDDVAEMKRLYVDPKRRGMSLGHKLIDELLGRARAMGYARVRLDTLSFMRGAARLYRAFDFEEIPPYRQPVVRGARFYERTLDDR